MGRPAIDITGKIFGRLTAIKRVGPTPNSGARWLCECECGNRKVMHSQKLRHATTPTRSCGCLRHKRLDLIGERFGKLTVVGFSHFQLPHKHSVWHCRCDCGSTRTVMGTNLRKGNSTTCGCGVRDKAINYHGAKGGYLVLSRYKRNAVNTRREWSLSDRQALRLFKSRCHYCGCEPATERKNTFAKPYLYNGIDRIDNTLGYTIKNSVPCCSSCNFAKGLRGQQEFLDHAIRIAAYQTSKRLTE